jgi:hypothetical protein
MIFIPFCRKQTRNMGVRYMFFCMYFIDRGIVFIVDVDVVMKRLFAATTAVLMQYVSNVILL